MLTRLLLAINIVAFGWEYFSGALTSDSSLLTDGALLGTLVRDGQWWRIFTSGFLHGGALHILFNMFALWQVGYVSRSSSSVPAAWRSSTSFRCSPAGCW